MAHKNQLSGTFDKSGAAAASRPLFRFLVYGSGGMDVESSGVKPLRVIYTALEKLVRNMPYAKIEHGFWGDLEGIVPTTQHDLNDPQVIDRLVRGRRCGNELAPAIQDEIDFAERWSREGPAHVILVSNGTIDDVDKAQPLLEKLLADNKHLTLDTILSEGTHPGTSAAGVLMKRLAERFNEQVGRPVVIGEDADALKTFAKIISTRYTAGSAPVRPAPIHL